MKKKLTIGFAVNTAVSGSADAINEEYSSPRTIQAITKALEDAGGRVIHINADKGVCDTLSQLNGELDIVFNKAEGILDIEARKSYVPRILEKLQIPYTGSGALVHETGNDKAQTRKILSNKVLNPGWQLFTNISDPVLKDIVYPLFVKPVGEGSSIGITQSCVVHSEQELREALRVVMEQTRQPAIVEEYLGGAEYNIGMVGDLVFPALKWELEKIPGKPLVRDSDVKAIDINYSTPVTCDEMGKKLALYAIRAHMGIGALDCSRSDFRAWEGEDGDPFFMEINLLPGLDPYKSDLPRAAMKAGVEHSDIVNSIMHSALTRVSKDPRYNGRFDGIETGGFRDAYENILKSAKYSETVVDGRSFKLLKPRDGL